MKPKCRCYINAKYNKTAWKTGKLPKPCPVEGHDRDLKDIGEDARRERRQITTLLLSDTQQYFRRVRQVEINGDTIICQHDLIMQDGTKMNQAWFEMSTEEFLKIYEALREVGK